MKSITNFTFLPLSQTGISFIEILFALMILTTGILALAKLQILALQNTYEAYLRSLAVTQMTSLSDALVIEHEGGLFVNHWEQCVKQLIPHATGNYIKSGNTAYMSVSWNSILKHDASVLEAYSRQF